MIKVRKGNVYYNIPDNQVLVFKYKGFEVVEAEEPKVEEVVEEESIVTETPKEEIPESDDLEGLMYDDLTPRYINGLTKHQCIAIAVSIGLTIDEKDHISKIKSNIMKHVRDK